MIQNHNHLLRCKMFFFHIKCEKNTKSFILQMLAAHNVAIILNILRCLNQNQDFKQHWGKSIFMSFHQKKNNIVCVCHNCFRNSVPNFYQWLIIKTERGNVMTSSVLTRFSHPNSCWVCLSSVLLERSWMCLEKDHSDRLLLLLSYHSACG